MHAADRRAEVVATDLGGAFHDQRVNTEDKRERGFERLHLTERLLATAQFRHFCFTIHDPRMHTAALPDETTGLTNRRCWGAAATGGSGRWNAREWSGT